MGIYQYFMLCGGLGFFLYGMHLMSSGFEQAAGDRLRHWLSVLTNNRLAGVAAGTGITAIIQSSSATTVMVVGFVNAGLMTLNQAIGVIMGANIGTTVTGVIIAFQLTKIAPIILLFGVVMRLFVKNRSTNRWGLIVLGFGMLFVGMQLMSDSMKPLASMPEIRTFMSGFKNPVIGVLIGVAVTGVIQSSSASIGILQIMALEGLLDIYSAFPLIMGMNIGTCVTAMLASIGTKTNARRTAVMHLMFNVFGVTLFLILSIFMDIPGLILRIAPGHDGAWDIATFHTLFNLINVIVLLPFAGKIVALVEKLIPDKEEPPEELRFKYIDIKLLSQPALVVPQLTKELERMAEVAMKNIRGAIDAFFGRSIDGLERIKERESLINYLNHNITPCLARAAGSELSELDQKIIGEMFHCCTDLERVGDHAENIMEYVEIILDKKLVFSEDALADARQIADMAIGQLDICLEAYFKRDLSIQEQMEASEEALNQFEDELRMRHIKRLNAGRCDARSSMIFTDLLTDLERVGDHAINILYLLRPNRDK